MIKTQNGPACPSQAFSLKCNLDALIPALFIAAVVEAALSENLLSSIILALTLSLQDPLGRDDRGTFLQKGPPLSGPSLLLEFTENENNNRREFLHGERGEEGE